MNIFKIKIGEAKITSILSLFASSSTLICCALPILLTLLGFGSVLLSIVEHVPFLSTLTANKNYLFVFIPPLLALNYWWIFKKKSESVDCKVTENIKEGETSCSLGNNFSKLVFKISLAIYGIGFFFAYLLLPLYRLLEK